MNILSHLVSGAKRSVLSWKWILVIWLATFFLVALVALPFKAGINSMIGSSMITEKLREGINLDFIANTGSSMSVLTSFLKSGIILVLLFGLLINVFFAGGLFTCLRMKDYGTARPGFFAGASSNFRSFLMISIMIYLLIIFLSFLVMGIPVMVAQGSDSEKAIFDTVKVTGAVLALLLPVVMLVADNARAWQAVTERKHAFRAIGNGFRLTFSRFFSSYLVIAAVMIVQLLFTWLVVKISGGMNPGSGGGIFIMFLLFQALFIVKIFLRTWRYASVTSLFEQ